MPNIFATHYKKVGRSSNKRPEKLNVHIRNSWRTNLQLIRSIGNMIGYKKSLSEVKMGRGSPIPPMLQRKIVEQYQKGVSQRNIAKSLKLSSSTMHNIIQRFRKSGTIPVRKQTSQVSRKFRESPAYWKRLPETRKLVKISQNLDRASKSAHAKQILCFKPCSARTAERERERETLRVCANVRVCEAHVRQRASWLACFCKSTNQLSVCDCKRHVEVSWQVSFHLHIIQASCQGYMKTTNSLDLFKVAMENK